MFKTSSKLMQIGITDTLITEDKYEHYVKWIQSTDESVEILKLSYLLNNLAGVEKLDGLILSGGGDLHPRYYGKEDQLHKTSGVNEERDEFEFAVIERALDTRIPILGICRGMQVMNVYLGGSLVVDLVSEGFKNHTSKSDDEATRHEISIEPQTLLSVLTGTSVTEVNSFHHQSVERLGKGLITSAISMDNVIEAGEWALKDNMPFLILVQWHPERLGKTFLSQKLANIFLREVYNYKIIKEQTSIDK